MASTELIRRRMMGSSDSVDWKALYMGIIDNTATDLIVPEGVTRIRVRLSSNSNIERVSFPSTLTFIGNYTFIGLIKITNVTIPSSVTTIGQQAFQGCTNMQYMILEGTTPPTIYSNSFASNNCLFYVPDSAVNTYKGANEWSNLASRIYPISELGGVILDYQPLSGFSAERSAA